MPSTRTRAPLPAGEVALVERIRRKAEAMRAGQGTEVRLGIGDDCAILRPRTGEEIVVTTDFCLEGRHFRRDWHSAASVGHRTLARGLSDLAAMGARPVAAFLSLALPRAVAQDESWVDGFLEGLLTLARRHHVPLAGGDTAESPSAHVLGDIVLLGAVPQGRALRRDRARAGQRLFVTGALGGSGWELASLRRTKKPPVRPGTRPGGHPQLFPEPRLRAGRLLLRRGLAAAAMDLSDGLSSDLERMCATSGVAAEIVADQLPVHPLLRDACAAAQLGATLHGGEDYELLFTAPATARVPRRLGGVALTEIGGITRARPGQPRVTLISADGTRSPLTPQGWEHLR